MDLLGGPVDVSEIPDEHLVQLDAARCRAHTCARPAARDILLQQSGAGGGGLRNTFIHHAKLVYIRGVLKDDLSCIISFHHSYVSS